METVNPVNWWDSDLYITRYPRRPNDNETSKAFSNFFAFFATVIVICFRKDNIIYVKYTALG